MHDRVDSIAGFNSHTVAARVGCTMIPFALRPRQENDPILYNGI